MGCYFWNLTSKKVDCVSDDDKRAHEQVERRYGSNLFIYLFIYCLFVLQYFIVGRVCLACCCYTTKKYQEVEPSAGYLRKKIKKNSSELLFVNKDTNYLS